jgi:glycosyltransferase involved in cell wall biosynthesis
LLLPFNSNASTKAFIQYSWPTKLAEYFASGTPILILGPRGVGFIEYTIENNCGFYVKEATVSAVKESIKQILICPQAVKTTTNNARRIAFDNFDNQKTRSSFQTELCSLGK